MPVKYAGAMPRPMEAVVTTGEVVSTAGGFVLGAQQVHKLLE